MEKSFKVWNNGSTQEISIGQEVLIFTVGAGRGYLGEFAKLEKGTARHLVFRTNSGTLIRTAKDNLNEVVGKAKKAGCNVSLIVEERKEDKDFTEAPIIL